MKKSLLTVAVSGFLFGCAVGPEYHRPEIDSPQSWSINIQTAYDYANTLWWKQFNDPVLNQLIQTALQENKDIQIASARVEEFMGRYGVTHSNQFPQVDLGTRGQRSRTSETIAMPDSINPSNTIQVDLDVSFDLDLWGRLKSASESARAQFLASKEAKQLVVMTLVSQLSSSYIHLLSLDQQLLITQETMKIRGEAVRINQIRFTSGQTSELHLQQSIAEYQNAAIQIPQLEKDISQQENAINLLLGRNPGHIVRGRSLDQLSLPQVPSGLPSDLLERRPDIRQAEQQLIAANAQIGVAKAAFYPNISLTGLFGVSSDELTSLFNGPSMIWNFAGRLIQPIFTGGSLTNQLKVSDAVQKQALLKYQQTIQKSFAEVNDALVAVSKLREQLKIEDTQIAALKKYLNLSELQYQNGMTDYLTVVDAQRNLYTAQMQQIRDQGLLMTALIQTYQTLGGGWVHQSEQMSVALK